jgi:hypothetical protein
MIRIFTAEIFFGRVGEGGIKQNIVADIISLSSTQQVHPSL